MKSKGKEYADDKRNVKSSEIREGDEVMVIQQLMSNKLAATFEPTVYKVLEIVVDLAYIFFATELKLYFFCIPN